MAGKMVKERLIKCRLAIDRTAFSIATAQPMRRSVRCLKASNIPGQQRRFAPRQPQTKASELVEHKFLLYV